MRASRTQPRSVTFPFGAFGASLDRVPWRPIHRRTTLVLGVGWMLDAFEVTIVGSVLGPLQKIWHLTPTQAALLVSAWLAGIMVGALGFGYLADRFGRRKLFLGTLLGYASLTLLSAFSPSYAVFLPLRFLTAIGVGAEYSAVNAAIAEIIPARYRGRANGVVMSFWALGAIAAGIVALVFVQALPPDFGWRVAFGFGAIIALFTLYARRTLPESPRWLARRGRTNEAAAVAELIGAQPHDLGPDAAATSRAHASFTAQLAELVRRWPGGLALGCALDFSEAAGYYGLFTMLPLVILPHVHVLDRDIPIFFIIGNVGALIGGLCASAALDALGRRTTVVGFYGLAALSMLGMALASGTGSALGVLVAFTVANACATGAWVSAYPAFSERFPTELRATGIGFSVAFGRIGALVAPPLLVALAGAGHVALAFAAMAGCWAIGAAAMLLWSTRHADANGRALEDLAAGRAA